MYRILFTYIFSIFLVGSAFGQITDQEINKSIYPANSKPDSKREAIFSTYFEDANVSNMHFYLPAGALEHDYLYKGTELPRGLFGIFDSKWRDEMPEDFKAYAVYAIRGEGKPYYVLRFSGEDTDPSIALFEMKGDKLSYKATLATYWCSESYCLQKDSWIQDFDGDVRLDILTKVKMTDDRRKKQLIEEYFTILQQKENGGFIANSKMNIDVNDYFMQDLVE